MLTITAKQMAMFGREQGTDFEKSMNKLLREQFPDRCLQLGEARTSAFVNQALTKR